MRAAWIDVDLDAIAHNARLMGSIAAPAALCAVVKADGYGHGAAPVARAALDAGASLLAVALVEEGAALRASGITAPILVLSEPPATDMEAVVEHDLTPTLYTSEGVAAAARAADSARTSLGVHLKVDTGMHRVGAQPAEVAWLAELIEREPNLRFAGCFTHLAVADAPDDPFTAEQLRRFETVRNDLARAGHSPEVVHAANSAATLTQPAARLDLVRIGIALYGLEPAPGLGEGLGLRPALSLRSEVSHVKTVTAGEAVSYGLRYRLERDSVIATVPVGYADGVRRALGAVGAEVLIGGRRCPIAGTVTMDQITVDCGPDAQVQRGDEVVLLGRQVDETIPVQEWADRLDTIGYEIVCGFGARLPRHHLPAGTS